MRKATLLAAASSVFFASPAFPQVTPDALPSGGQVAAGAATISTASPGRMNIDQSSERAILNWQSFSIGSAAHVNFNQPGASAIALNRVLGNNPSEIFGRLTANGQIFLTNPNGVLFAPGASVDVGGIVATTLSITDQDFLAGRNVFSRYGSAGSVVNQGTIVAVNGYAALAGPQVRNDGLIVAQLGTVALAAGDRVTLDLVGDRLISVSVDQAALNASVVSTGTIEAAGGRVLLSAKSANALLDTVLSHSGTIRASHLAGRDGEIVLAGGPTGVVDVSGVLEAERIAVTGGGGGSGPIIPTDPVLPPGVIILPGGGTPPAAVTESIGTFLAAIGVNLSVSSLSGVTLAGITTGGTVVGAPTGLAASPGQIGLGGNGLALSALPAQSIVGTGVSLPADTLLTPR